MSLLKTVGNIFRQHAENLDKALSDPARDGHLAIEDAQKEVNDFEAKLHDLVAQTITLRQKRDAALANVAKFTTLAANAAKAQNKEDVVAALTEKQRAQTNVDSLNKDIEANEKVQENAKAHIADVRSQIENAKNTEQQATVRIATADLRSKLASSTSTFGKNNGLASINQLNQAADSAEANAQATEELSAETPAAKAAALEAKYGSSNTGSNLDDEAEKLIAEASAK